MKPEWMKLVVAIGVAAMVLGAGMITLAFFLLSNIALRDNHKELFDDYAGAATVGLLILAVGSGMAAGFYQLKMEEEAKRKKEQEAKKLIQGQVSTPITVQSAPNAPKNANTENATQETLREVRGFREDFTERSNDNEQANRRAASVTIFLSGFAFVLVGQVVPGIVMVVGSTALLLRHQIRTMFGA